MNFDFSPEQEQFREQIRRFLERSNGLEHARSVLEKKSNHYSSVIWQGLAELGVQATAIPEVHSGLGLGALELCVAAEEIGRAMAPVPFFSSICVCAEAIRLFGSGEQQAKWLPGLADGSIIGTWGTAEDGGAGTETRWRSGRLNGKKRPVLDAMIAQVMLVVAQDEKGGIVLALCDLDQPGIKRRPVETVDPTRPAAEVEFNGASAELLASGSDAHAAWETIRDRAAILLAFEQVGSAEAALEMARCYAHDRVAFGRKIGSFQAIKHKLADMFVKLELARSHCYYGAWAISTHAKEAALAAAGARCSAIDALDYAAQENIQVHGGIGVTWESNCHFFYRRARLNGLILGSRFEWQDRLVAALVTTRPS